MTARRRGEAGQAAVELALCLPLLAAIGLALLQVALVGRDQVVLTHAAREAAREAAVSSEPGAPRRAALAGAHLDPDRLEVEVQGRGRPGSRVTVTLRYAAPTDVPLVGPLVGDVELRETVAMRVETRRTVSKITLRERNRQEARHDEANFSSWQVVRGH